MQFQQHRCHIDAALNPAGGGAGRESAGGFRDHGPTLDHGTRHGQPGPAFHDHGNRLWANSVIALPRRPGRAPPRPGRSQATHLSQPAHPLRGSPDPVGVFFPIGDLTANMVVNPPTGKKSPRSFSHHPGTSPASPPATRKPGPPPRKPGPPPRKPGPPSASPAGVHAGDVPDRHPRPWAHITEFAPEPGNLHGQSAE